MAILRSKLIWGLSLGLILGPVLVREGHTICDIGAVFPAFCDRIAWGGLIGLVAGLVLDVAKAMNVSLPRALCVVVFVWVLPMLILIANNAFGGYSIVRLLD